MSTHNICFPGEIRKIFIGILLIPTAMIPMKLTIYKCIWLNIYILNVIIFSMIKQPFLLQFISQCKTLGYHVI